MWYEWDSLELFNQWHTSICLLLGIPNEHTTSYTDVYEVNGKWIAVVDDKESNNLTATNLRLPVIDRGA